MWLHVSFSLPQLALSVCHDFPQKTVNVWKAVYKLVISPGHSGHGSAHKLYLLPFKQISWHKLHQRPAKKRWTKTFFVRRRLSHCASTLTGRFSSSLRNCHEYLGTHGRFLSDRTAWHLLIARELCCQRSERRVVLTPSPCHPHHRKNRLQWAQAHIHCPLRELDNPPAWKGIHGELKVLWSWVISASISDLGLSFSRISACIREIRWQLSGKTTKIWRPMLHHFSMKHPKSLFPAGQCPMPYSSCYPTINEG